MRFDAALLEPVARWARVSRKTFRPNGFGRQYGVLQDLTPPAEAWVIKHQIVEAHGLYDAEQEPMFKDLCGLITEGGAIHLVINLYNLGTQQ